MVSRTPTSPTSIGKRMSMFSTFFSGPKEACSKPAAAPGLSPGEADCLHDDKLESATLTSIWRSPSSKLDGNEKALLEELHTAYVSRTEALRTYQSTLLTLTEQLADLKTSNSALKAQLDVTSQAHATLLTEITNPDSRRISLTHDQDGRTSPQSEGDDSGWWSDSGIGPEEEEDNMTLTQSSPDLRPMRRGSRATSWLSSHRSTSPAEVGEVKLLKKENARLRDEIDRLEAVLEDCSIVLGGMEAKR